MGVDHEVPDEIVDVARIEQRRWIYVGLRDRVGFGVHRPGYQRADQRQPDDLSRSTDGETASEMGAVRVTEDEQRVRSDLVVDEILEEVDDIVGGLDRVV